MSTNKHDNGECMTCFGGSADRRSAEATPFDRCSHCSHDIVSPYQKCSNGAYCVPIPRSAEATADDSEWLDVVKAQRRNAYERGVADGQRSDNDQDPPKPTGAGDGRVDRPVASLEPGRDAHEGPDQSQSTLLKDRSSEALAHRRCDCGKFGRFDSERGVYVCDSCAREWDFVDEKQVPVVHGKATECFGCKAVAKGAVDECPRHPGEQVSADATRKARTRCMGCGHFDNEIEAMPSERPCDAYGTHGHYMLDVDARGIAIPPSLTEPPDWSKRADDFFDRCEDPRLAREWAVAALRDEYINVYALGMLVGVRASNEERLILARELYALKSAQRRERAKESERLDEVEAVIAYVLNDGTTPPRVARRIMRDLREERHRTFRTSPSSSDPQAPEAKEKP